jgi:hypothetical protein
MPNYVRNPTWADGAGGGTAITAAKLNNIEDGIYYSHFQPAARAYHNANQSTTSATPFVLAFNSERFDTDTIHDTATNNSRLTCKTAGKYQITGQVRWAANATGDRYVVIQLNGATPLAEVWQQAVTVAAIPTAQICATLYDLAVNDYVELVAQQTSGGALNVIATGNASPEFSMFRVA